MDYKEFMEQRRIFDSGMCNYPVFNPSRRRFEMVELLKENGKMSDLIDREDVLALAKDIVVPTTDGEYRHRCIDPQEVRDLPPAQPQRMHGRWEKKPHVVMLPLDAPPVYDDESYNPEEHSIVVYWWHCSKCGYEANRDMKPKHNFCPNCGADMREESNEKPN